MSGQRCGRRPSHSDADQGIEIAQLRLIDTADMAGKIAAHGASGQVIDHFAVHTTPEQIHSGLFQRRVLPQEDGVGAVGQVEQGQATVLFDNERQPGERARSLMRGVLSTNRQLHRQQRDALPINGIRLG